MSRSLRSIFIFLFLINYYAVADGNVYQTLCDTIPDSTIVSRKIVITGVGDIMLGSSFPSSRFLPPHDNPFLLLESVKDTLINSDITFGNLEGSFLDEGDPVKKCKDTTICYLFQNAGEIHLSSYFIGI